MVGGTAVIPPISRTLKLGRFGDGTARPPSIWVQDDRTASGKDEATAGWGREYALNIPFLIRRAGSLDLGNGGFMGFLSAG